MTEDSVPRVASLIESPPPWQRILRWLGLLLLVAIVLWAVKHLDWRGFAQAILRSDWRLLALAGLANIVAMGLQAWRWHILLRALGSVRYLDAFSGLIVGFATSSVVPARAGEIVRIHAVARRMRTSMAPIAGTTVLDHVVNGISAIPLLAVVPLLGQVPGWMQRGMVVVLGVVSAAALLAWLSASPSAEGNDRSAWRRAIARVRRGLGGARSPRRMSEAAAASTLAWVAEVGVVWLTLRAFHSTFGMSVAILTLISVNMAMAIPSPPANLGTLELGAVLVLVGFGMPREEAVAFALAYHAVQLVSLWILGLPAWWWSRRPVPVAG